MVVVSFLSVYHRSCCAWLKYTTHTHRSVHTCPIARYGSELAERNSDICFLRFCWKIESPSASCVRERRMATAWQKWHRAKWREKGNSHICNNINTIIIFATICRWLCENSAMWLRTLSLQLSPTSVTPHRHKNQKVLILVSFYICNYARDFFSAFPLLLGAHCRAIAMAVTVLAHVCERLNACRWWYFIVAQWERNIGGYASDGDTNQCNKRFICVLSGYPARSMDQWSTYFYALTLSLTEQSTHTHTHNVRFDTLLNSMYFHSEFLFRFGKITHSISKRASERVNGISRQTARRSPVEKCNVIKYSIRRVYQCVGHAATETRAFRTKVRNTFVRVARHVTRNE